MKNLFIVENLWNVHREFYEVYSSSKHVQKEDVSINHNLVYKFLDSTRLLCDMPLEKRPDECRFLTETDVSVITHPSTHGYQVFVLHRAPLNFSACAYVSILLLESLVLKPDMRFEFSMALMPIKKVDVPGIGKVNRFEEHISHAILLYSLEDHLDQNELDTLRVRLFLDIVKMIDKIGMYNKAPESDDSCFAIAIKSSILIKK